MLDDTTTARDAIDRKPVLRAGFPKVSIGAALFSISIAIGQAFEMVYAAPYQPTRHRPKVGIDPELQGRDPNW